MDAVAATPKAHRVSEWVMNTTGLSDQQIADTVDRARVREARLCGCADCAAFLRATGATTSEGPRA